MPTMEDPGFEVPPAPWEYDDSGNDESDGDSSSDSVEGASGGYSGSSGGGGDGEQKDSGDSGGGGESSGDYGEDPERVYSQNWNSGADYNPYPEQDYSSEKLGSDPELVYYGGNQPGSPYYDVSEFQAGTAPSENSQGQGYAEMRNQYNEAGIGAGGSAPDDSNQGQGWKTMRDQYDAAGIGAGGSKPSNIGQGEGWNLMREQYNAAGIGAGGSAARDIGQGEGWKIMRDQYNEAGLGAGGTAPQPQNRWEAATLPNLLAWGAGYGNAMGQTPQQMADWANQSIQQWNSAHPDDQYPLLPPVVGPRMPELPRPVEGPKMPAQPPDKKLTQTDVPWYDPKSGRWIQPGSVVPGANNPMGRTSPTGPAAPEGLWASVQSLWRTLTDPRYARSQAFGGYVDPSGGQWANRDRWPTSLGDLLEGLNRSTTQTDRVNFGPPLNPETLKAIERVNQLGAWAEKNESMSEHAETYQAYVTGMPGQVFKYNGADFDGFNGNALLDAKDHYEGFIDRKTGDWKDFFAISSSGVGSFVKRANRQVGAAQGAPIEWHFNEKGPAELVKKLFEDEGIEGIEVIYDPMPAN